MNQHSYPELTLESKLQAIEAQEEFLSGGYITCLELLNQSMYRLIQADTQETEAVKMLVLKIISDNRWNAEMRKHYRRYRTLITVACSLWSEVSEKLKEWKRKVDKAEEENDRRSQRRRRLESDLWSALLIS
jgi:hypothetical protein